MTDHPILFSAPMVRALLDGRKTQTRSLLKPQPDGWSPEPKLTEIHRIKDGHPVCPTEEGAILGMGFASEDGLNGFVSKYQIGDRLWVRENWRRCAWCPAEYDDMGGSGMAVTLEYKADNSQIVVRDASFNIETAHLSTISSAFMPRWASRLTLVVTDVRVQRLQDIDHRDICAEGWPGDETQRAMAEAFNDCDDACIEWFSDLWESINGPGAWAANPWVVAVSFTVHKCNIDRMAA